ncbi:MAG: PqqD family protein [Elusimicrobiota bacterium]
MNSKKSIKGRMVLTREQSLTAVPRKNGLITEDKRGEEEVVLKLPLKYKGINSFFAWMFILPKNRIVALDPIGTVIWDACDGQRTVAGLIQIIVEKYKLSFKESELSIFEYVRNLVERGLVQLDVKK